jgi:hypothetical protein
MPVEADIVAYLDPLIAEAAGIDLFEGPAPELPDNLIAVAHYDSLRSDDYTMGASLSAPASEIELVQVMTRNTDKATAQARADAVYALLDNLQNATINGRSYFHVESDGPPSGLGQDVNQRWRFVANYQVRKVRG